MDGRRSYPDDSDSRWYPADRATGDQERLPRRPAEPPRPYDTGGTTYDNGGFGARPYEEGDEFAAPPRGSSDSFAAPPRSSTDSFAPQSRGRRAAGDRGEGSGRYSALSDLGEPDVSQAGRPSPTGSRSGAPLFTPDEAARLHAAQAATAQAARSAPAYPGTGPIMGVPAGPPPAGLTPPAPTTYGGVIPTQGSTDYGTGSVPVSPSPAGPMTGGFAARPAHDPATAPHELVSTEPAVNANPTPPRPVSDNVYRARRPAVAIGLSVIAVVVGLFFLRALVYATFGPTYLIGGVIGAALALVALPLLVLGLYGLVTGAAHGAEQAGFRLWAKPPLAYLVVALVLLLAAATAVG